MSSNIDLCLRTMRWILAISGHLFGGVGLVWWCLSFSDPDAAAYAIAYLSIATASEYARRITV